jgi:hypothetical protein
MRCEAALDPEQPAWFRTHWEGLLCKDCRGEEAWALSSASRDLARNMLAAPLEALPEERWTRQRAEDLRRFLGQQMERHLERRLVTRRQLEELP